MEEKELFESYGWEYDYIKRKWIAPDGQYIEQDSLVALNDSPETELTLRNLVIMHGRRSKDTT